MYEIVATEVSQENRHFRFGLSYNCLEKLACVQLCGYMWIKGRKKW